MVDVCGRPWLTQAACCICNQSPRRRRRETQSTSQAATSFVSRMRSRLGARPLSRRYQIRRCQVCCVNVELPSHSSRPDQVAVGGECTERRGESRDAAVQYQSPACLDFKDAGKLGHPRDAGLPRNVGLPRNTEPGTWTPEHLSRGHPSRGHLSKGYLSRALIAAVKLYRAFPSSRLPSCRFDPTCSQYALDALRIWGARRGVLLTMRRICRCHPWGGWGYDPVPKTWDTRLGRGANVAARGVEH